MPFHFARRNYAVTSGFLLDAAIAEAQADEKKASGGSGGGKSDVEIAAGFVHDLSPVLQSFVEIAAGTPQKEERTALALARAAEATASKSTFGAATSPGPLGVPILGWLAIAGIGIYALTRKG